jgi:hypothetical protein
MTKIEILELNIRDQNELISDLDLACKEMEDLLSAAYPLIYGFPAFVPRMFPDLWKIRAEWLDQFTKWNDALEKIEDRRSNSTTQNPRRVLTINYRTPLAKLIRAAGNVFKGSKQ